MASGSGSGSGESPQQGTNVVKVCLSASNGQWGVWVRDPVPGARRNFLGFFTQEEMEVNGIHIMPGEESPVNMLQINSGYPNTGSASSSKQELNENTLPNSSPNSAPNYDPTPPLTPANDPESTSDDSEDLDSGRVDWDRVLEYVEASSARLGDSMEARTAEGNGQDRRNLIPIGLQGLSDEAMDEAMDEPAAQNIPGLSDLNALADVAEEVHSDLDSEMGDPVERAKLV